MDFNMTPYDGNLDESNGFQKLNLNKSQMERISQLWNEAPALMETDILTKAYRIEFPEGVQGFLMKYKNGGQGTPVQGKDGKIVGHAALYSLDKQAMMLGAFSAMSIASGQYFLSQINSELKMLKLSVDRILEFLYGDKKAELMAELGFAKYAYENYISIMEHEAQRIATITSLQEARKVAVKDIEFYMVDLDRMTQFKAGNKVAVMTEESLKIKECLELSIQLYTMSTLLEVFYSQNFDADYLKCVENDISTYTGKTDSRILGCFSSLRTCIDQYKAKPLEKLDKEVVSKPVIDIIEYLQNGEDSDIRKAVHSSLDSVSKKTVLYFTESGETYCKSA